MDSGGGSSGGPAGAIPNIGSTASAFTTGIVVGPSSLDCTQAGSLNLPLYQTPYSLVHQPPQHPPPPAHFYPSGSGMAMNGPGSLLPMDSKTGPGPSNSSGHQRPGLSGGGGGGGGVSGVTSGSDRSESPMQVGLAVQQSPVASH